MNFNRFFIINLVIANSFVSVQCMRQPSQELISARRARTSAYTRIGYAQLSDATIARIEDLPNLRPTKTAASSARLEHCISIRKYEQYQQRTDELFLECQEILDSLDNIPTPVITKTPSTPAIQSDLTTKQKHIEHSVQ